MSRPLPRRSRPSASIGRVRSALRCRLLLRYAGVNLLILLGCLSGGCSLVLELDAPVQVVGRDGGDAGRAGDGGLLDRGLEDSSTLRDADAHGGDRGPEPDGETADGDRPRPDEGLDARTGDASVDGGLPDADPPDPEDVWVWVPTNAIVMPLLPDNSLGAPAPISADGLATFAAPMPSGVVIYEGIRDQDARATLILGVDARDRIDLRPAVVPEVAVQLGRTQLGYANPQPVSARHDLTIGCFGTLVDPPGTAQFDLFSDCVSEVRDQGAPTFSALAIAYDPDDVPVAFTHATDLLPSMLTEVTLPDWRDDFRPLDLVFRPGDQGTRVRAHAALMRHELVFGILGEQSVALNPLINSRISLPLAEGFGEEAIEVWFEAERTYNGLPTVRRFFSRLAAFQDVLTFDVESQVPPGLNRIDPPDGDDALLSWRDREGAGAVSGVWAQALWSGPLGRFEWRVLVEPGTRRVILPALPPDLLGPVGTRTSLQVTLLNCDAAQSFADLRNGLCPLGHRSFPRGWRGTVRTSTAIGP